MAADASQFKGDPATGLKTDAQGKEATAKKTDIFQETVRPGEGFWQPTLRLVIKKSGDACQNPVGNKRLCAQMRYYYNSLTAEILAKNGVIKNNSELRIKQPGIVLALDQTDNLFINGTPAANYASD